MELCLELVAPSQWNHVNGAQNPADSAPRGLFPSELIKHELWWNGPNGYAGAHQPKQSPLTDNGKLEFGGRLQRN